jgi:hypothetical protein
MRQKSRTTGDRGTTGILSYICFHFPRDPRGCFRRFVFQGHQKSHERRYAQQRTVRWVCFLATEME